MTQRILFCDIDGTLVHYVDGDGSIGAEPDEQGLHTFTSQGETTPALPLPLSSTGLRGWISTPTFHKIAAIRATGAKFVLISGARTSTIIQRLPYLPAADAVVTENGGRVFVADASWPSCFPIREDLRWRAMHASTAGPASDEAKAPAEREGPLWDVYRQFKAEGAKLDTTSYSTMFRASPGASSCDLATLLGGLPAGLVSTYNLGKADVYPGTSGKAAAARYLMAMWGADAEDCGFLCDDDNDIELAGAVGRAFLPSISSDSMREAVAADAGHYFVAAKEALLGTEEAVDAVQRAWSTPGTGASACAAAAPAAAGV